METKLLSNKILEKQIEIEDRFLTSSHLQSCQLLVRGEGSLRHILQLVSWEISDIMKNCSHQIFTISNVIIFYMNYTDKTNTSKTYIRFNWEAVWKAWAPISVMLLFNKTNIITIFIHYDFISIEFYTNYIIYCKFCF